MKIPPFIIGASLLLWAIESDRVFIGALLFLVLEGSHLVKSRYTFDDEEFIRISDLTSLFFLGGVALILLNYEPIGFLRITAGWLPLILFPLIVAQLYSSGDTITIGTRLGNKKKGHAHKPIDFRLYYIVVCLFGAAASNSRSLWFFPAAAVILAILFYANRGRSYRTPFLALFLASSLVLAYMGSVAMEAGHGYVVHKSFRYFYRYYLDKHADPFKSHVNFGDTGRLKSSGEIRMRVSAGDASPMLLREAVYSSYLKGNWFGRQSGFQFVAPESEDLWRFVEQPYPQGSSVTIELSLPEEKGLLPLPAGTFRLASSTVFEVEMNHSGVLKAVDATPVATYEVDYTNLKLKNVDTPLPSNLEVPENEHYALLKVKELLGGDALSEREKLDAVNDFFARGFSYSLNLVGRGEYATPLGNFLLGKKSGFCEYYATATALLLRVMDIPSRYVIGYAVSEWSALEGKYIVRSRHGHAWVEAYVGKSWVTVDTTPSQWLEVDAQRASFFEPVGDLFNFLRYKYRLFRIGTGEDYTLILSFVVVALTAFLTIRIYRRMQLARAVELPKNERRRSFPRIITPFTSIIDALAEADVERQENESFSEWSARCFSWEQFDSEEFDHLYSLHLRMRFDPVQPDEQVREVLRSGAEKYLEDLRYLEKKGKTSIFGK